MSKKDFEAIAAILAGDFASATPAEKGKVWCLTLSLADYFAQSNSNFDRAKFYDAVNPQHSATVKRHPDFRVVSTAATFTPNEERNFRAPRVGSWTGEWYA